MTFLVKKKSKKIPGSKSDDNISSNIVEFSEKIDKRTKESTIHKLSVSESSSICSYKTKRFSFFRRIYHNKIKKLSRSRKPKEDLSNVSISKINVNTSTFYDSEPILSPSRIYENIQHASPSSSIFDKSHIFERSVDYSSLVSPSTSISFTPSVYKTHLIDSTHQRRMVDNHVPTVLDASMEILSDSSNMDNIEIISIKRLYSSTLSSDAFQPKDSSASYTSSLYTRETSLSFVSYADLVNVDHCYPFSPILTVTDTSKTATLRSNPEYISLNQTLLGTEVKRLLSNTDNISDT